MLEHYYDIGRRDQFDALFSGLWIHEHPTPERNAHLVLKLDFSGVNVGSGQKTLERTFFLAVRGGVESFLLRYRDLVPDLRRIDERLSTYRDPDGLIMELWSILEETEHKVYLQIELKAGALVFVGARDVLFRPFPPDEPIRMARAPRKRQPK